MNMEKLNQRVLRNGMTRGEYIKSLMDKQGIGMLKKPYFGPFKKWEHVAYGLESDRQIYSVFTPIFGSAPFPVVVVIHGGGWYGGTIDDGGLGSEGIPMLYHGFAIVTIGYRLVDEAIYPDTVLDVERGLAHVLSRSEKYSLDPTRLLIGGGSAGSTLAVQVALRNPGKFRGCLADAGIYDFAAIPAQLAEMGSLGATRTRWGTPEDDTSIEALLMGGTVQEKPEVARDLNPANHLTPDCPAFLLHHGRLDPITPCAQSIEFAQAIRRVAGDSKVELCILEDTPHSEREYYARETLERKIDFAKRMVDLS